MDLFWDFDGTLFDTYPIMVKSFKHALMTNGITVTNQDLHELYRQMRQESLGQTLKTVAAKNKLNSEDLEQTYRSNEATLLANAQPFESAYDICQKNVQNHGRNFLLTHRDDQAKKLLQKHGFELLFSGAVTGANNFPRKPNPASLNFLIQKFQAEKKTAIMIGDRNLDISAAHNAGIQGILFDPDNLIQVNSQPERKINNLSELSVLV
ncbi:hydrolase, haloacid dehalogenase-like family [Pediococcus damnosus]|uniref:Hydrolase, haloacid dehalogenase-like family n=1 Tax=Pediococcus damnosus TaxID=51663 RepID=A0A0R2HKI6_9LACO|nr:HAD-IA family hydrolase [Pediococcus damnosus]AMV61598.1 hydrolase, haloacid dehalogenase-like family [Pediococcus damnosus]AMV62040.1 hydrolase, haloacid dehalogenase-like family [Pediococcus damnosus]AMV65959.1 hydrolase, haloacid dehalogenase-like family [Pediococcus damnosus]AMV68110.1 hydrolase, haloacid dehalogenase-like family [Pediococcus damnosus]AMV70295.1 hydrolase, haloacid dehalogenase-like family [Pediococcus damnosus]